MASISPATVVSFADETACYLRLLEGHFRVSIRRIAIDAPSDFRASHLGRRLAETCLDRQGISCFATPSAAEFNSICDKVRAHLKAGGAESRLPHANQLWMLAGFALFNRLRLDWECLEVYPQATMCVLGAHSIHKAKAGGVLAQLRAVARHTGWPEKASSQISELRLKEVVRAPLHDALDAYTSAWVAALDVQARTTFGSPPHDAIWVPRLPGSESEPTSSRLAPHG